VQQVSRSNWIFGIYSFEGDPGVAVSMRESGWQLGSRPRYTDGVDQIVGAAAMGVGAALHERFIYDPSGNPVSSNLSDYLIPTGTDLPSMDVFVFESAPAGGNPLGVKGVGEAGIVGVGAAIANAVVDALGSGGDAVVTRLPIDRQSIAMHHAGGRSAG